jgi:hypothetical protein
MICLIGLLGGLLIALFTSSLICLCLIASVDLFGLPLLAGG